jgi:hypothetical protein
MLISVLGTPSALTYWGVHLLATIMQVVYGDTHYVHSIYMDDLRDAWFKRDGKNVMLVSECPESRIADLVVKSGAPIFVFADDPNDVIGYVMASRGFDVYNALRFASQCFCTLSDVLKEPSAIRVRGNHYDSDVHELVRQFLEAVANPEREEQLEQVMRHLVPGYRAGQERSVAHHILANFRDAQPPGTFLTCLSRELQELATTVIGQYEPILLGQPLGELVWPRELFLHSDPAGKFLPRAIELAGPARFLAWGPYMHLPRGEWDITIEIEVNENYSGNHLQVDLLSGTKVLSSLHAELPIRGIFSFNIQVAITEPQHAIEIRFFLLSGAIEGVFALRPVRLRPFLRA